MIALGVASLSCASIATVAAIAEEKPTAKDVFSYTDVTATCEATDGKTANKGLLLSATKSGASAKLVSAHVGLFEANVKGLTKDGQIAIDNYSIKITDNDTGEAFKIGVLDKKDYANVYVEVANGNRGGIFYTNDSYNIFPPGATAGSNTLMQQYTLFYRNTKVGEEHAGFADSVKLRFNPETMEVSLLRGIYEYTKPEYALVWDLDEQINEGHDIGYSYSKFEDYSVEVVFDTVIGGGDLLVYSMAGIDFSSEDVVNPTTVRADVNLNAVKESEYAIPAATAFTPFGKTADKVNVTVVNEGDTLTLSQNNTVTPTKAGKMEITYALANDATVFTKYTVNVVERAAHGVATPCIVGGTVGVNAVIDVPETTMSSNLLVKESDKLAKVSVYRDGALYQELKDKNEAFSFVAAEAGNYEIKYVSAVSDTIVHSVSFTASAKEVAVVAEKLAPVYELHSKLTLNPAKVYYDGGEIAATAKVIYPSGKMEGAGSLLLDEVGDYTVIHSYEHNGAKQYPQAFSVEQTAESMFSKSDSKTEISYGAMAGNQTVSGVRLSLVENKPVAYEQIIDLSDNTKDDMFLELMAQPKTVGNNDITMVYITLTDVENEDNRMDIRLAYTQYTAHATYVTAKGGDKQWYTGWNEGYQTVENDTWHFVYGFLSRHSFMQVPRSNYSYQSSTLQLKYDYEENALYSNPDKAGDPQLVCDFDDEKFFGENLWGGFNSGKVKLSLYGTGITSTGDLYVLEVDGKRFAKETYTDDVAPVITPKFVGNTVPVAEVGKEYKIVEHQAIDAYSAVKYSASEVYYNGEKITVQNGAFVPEKTGVYTITYKATDSFGNESTRSIYVNALPKVVAPKLSVDGDVAKTVAYGQKVVLPSYTITGGAGGLEGKLTVTVNGKPVEIVANQFLANEIGTYVVNYTVTDYLGSTESKNYFIDCQYSLYPIIDETQISLPPAFIDGESYTFDDYKAVFYMSGDSKSYISPKIEVTDAEGKKTLDGLTYTPVVLSGDETAVDKITVSFLFEKEGAQTLKITREIPTIYFTGDEGEQAKYFITENATPLADSKGIVFNATAGATSFKMSFARALSIRNLRFLVSGKNAEGVTVLKNYGSLKVTLRDSRNPAQAVCVTYVKNGGALAVTLNGRTVNSSFNRDGEMEFRYDQDTHVISDVNDISLGRLTETVEGLPFNGFDSGEVYVCVEVCDVVGECALAFKSINNQGFNYIPGDRVDPVLWVNGFISGSYQLGAKIVIPSAGAYDVLSAITPVTVTVKAPDGTVVLKQADASQEYVLTMGQYGTYFVRYEVKDASRRTKIVTMSAIVRDIAAPTLTFTEEIATTVKVGASISLHNYVIEDNKDISDVTVVVSLFKPDGSYGIVTDDSLTFTKEGNYILTFLALDADNNVTVYDFNIAVTK